MSGCFYLADNTKICYTYDNLSRVTNRTIKNECDCVISSENFTYDAAGNITDAPNSCFVYDTNNRLITFNGNTVSYDMDGNMVSNGYINCEFDSGNRLLKAGINEYVYNAEDVRIKNLCQGDVTTYTYNTNCKLSQLLQKTTNGITTKYVYGLGLIGEEKEGCFKTYHFDFRGSTVAITDTCGNITDTFKYDTYGKLISRTGNSFVILGYNGRDGVVTDKNGLLYMRARYYSPDMRRFVNADIISGEISNAITLNRYAYANGNPVSNIDPFGLSPDERGMKAAANHDVFFGLENLYNFAYRYYDFVTNEKQRMQFSNDAAMKFIMYKQYYTGNTKKLAWEAIAGNLDYGAINYLESCVVCDYMQYNPDFYGNEYGNKIDFTHLIATLNANSFDRIGEGVIGDTLNTYAGWAGDLITLAGEASGEKNISKFVENALGGSGTSFSNADLLADIDAVNISKMLSNKPIYQAFNEYYSNGIDNRYSSFVNNAFAGSAKIIKSVAQSYLNTNSITTKAFMKVFNSNYSNSIIGDVAQGFANYIQSQL